MPTPISVIIPVYNENRIIQHSLDHLSDLENSGSLEIIVVDGDPEGSSLKAVSSPSVIKIISPKGRALQMNQGAAIAKGDILLFLHVDTHLPMNAVNLIRSAAASNQYMGGAFNLGINAKGVAFRIIETGVRFRTCLTRIPYGDQAFFIKRKSFLEIGGFPDIPLMEDVELLRKIKRKGHRIAIIKTCIKTSSRRWEKEGIVFCTLRNWLLLFLYYCGMSPNRLKKYYPPRGTT